MPLASTQSASASDGCSAALLGEVLERDADRPGAVLGVGEDELSSVLGAEGVLLGERVVPRGAGAGAPLGVGERARACASAGPFTISCHGGIAAVAIDVSKPSMGLERLVAAAEVPGGEALLDLAAAHAVTERQAADAAPARPSPTRRAGRSLLARDHLEGRAGWRAITSSSASSSAPSHRRLGTSSPLPVGVEPVRRHPERAGARARRRAARPSRRSRRWCAARSHASWPMTDARSALCAVYANGCTAVACLRRDGRRTRPSSTSPTARTCRRARAAAPR